MKTRWKSPKGVPLRAFFRPGVIERFIAKIKRGPGCWIWKGHCHPKGHGSFMMYPYRPVAAHVVAWILGNEEKVPRGLCVLHRCGTANCARGSHLYLGDEHDNHADMVAHGTSTRGERNQRSKLTKEIVLEIRRLHASGVKNKDLARRFGVSEATTSQAVHRRSWSWLNA